jgi:hypothetical protein
MSAAELNALEYVRAFLGLQMDHSVPQPRTCYKPLQEDGIDVTEEDVSLLRTSAEGAG